MAKKTFHVNIFSRASIGQLKKHLNEYNHSLSEKCDLIVSRLAKIASNIIEINIADAQITFDEKNIQSGADTSHYTSIKVTSLTNYARADILVSGREVIFIEFGSGVYYNGPPGSSTHPKGQEFGFVVGSYGKGQGVRQVWGYYADNGELVLTHGVKATMPMYKAIMEVYTQAPKVVKEVFK